jgi:hypothetical protein
MLGGLLCLLLVAAVAIVFWIGLQRDLPRDLPECGSSSCLPAQPERPGLDQGRSEDITSGGQGK